MTFVAIAYHCSLITGEAATRKNTLSFVATSDYSSPGMEKRKKGTLRLRTCDSDMKGGRHVSNQ